MRGITANLAKLVRHAKVQPLAPSTYQNVSDKLNGSQTAPSLIDSEGSSRDCHTYDSQASPATSLATSCASSSFSSCQSDGNNIYDTDDDARSVVTEEDCDLDDEADKWAVCAGRTLLTFDADKIVPLRVLGAGSFGTVVLSEYTHGTRTARYAVKRIAKVGLSASGLQAIMDEKSILTELRNSPFILQLVGTCQSCDEVMFITETIGCGELWNAIYDDSSSRMPHELSQFYAAGILLGLDHMHSRGIVYRDLKPENVMIDNMGYPKLIDVGLAKKLSPGKPQQHQVVGGGDKPALPTECRTLCGTPEYFAPEIIFGTGYDHTVDLWALGCILYEMITGRLPFTGPVNKDNTQDDLKQLFTNIAHVKKSGIQLSTSLDAKAGRKPHARSLLTQLFSGDPAKRLGPRANEEAPPTRSLMGHEYFASAPFTTETLLSRSFPAPWLQPEFDGDEGRELLPAAAFSGDQSLFADF